MKDFNGNTNGSVYIDPTKFYWVPTRVEPNGCPTYPVYPAPQVPVCPGCGRCPVCGRQATPYVTITYGNTIPSRPQFC